MKFYSTNDKSLRIAFVDAVRMGLAPDGGLFMPEKIERLQESFWDKFESLSFEELAFEIARAFLTDSL
ncbi:MAG TPA: hypothetical protein VG737_00040, partial [Cyclobacteriaceae bacterium]|nr:hypothetical protein [Cyclobacteriaceae bacterium]